MQFHHFGLAVQRPDHAAKFLASLGYARGDTIYDPLQKVNLSLCTHADMPNVELVWKADADGPLSDILQRADARMYHTCYEVSNAETALRHFDSAGIRYTCISPPTPAILFGGRLVSFYQVRGFGLIEILESTPATEPAGSRQTLR